MALFKSRVDKAIGRTRALLSEISDRYARLTGPIKMIGREKDLTPEQAESVKTLKGFQFYPQLGPLEHGFFESAQPASYRLQRAAQLGVIRQSKKLPPRVVSVKGKSVRFAEAVGLPVPRSEYPLKLDEITFDQPSVIKPVHIEGGRWIYALRKESDGRLRELFSDKTYPDEAALRAAIRQALEEKGGKSRDAWLKEEMIVGSSGSPLDTVDVKMYTFYGKVGLVLQVDRWRGRVYRFFDRAGELVDTGKYSAAPGVEPVFDQTLIDEAERVSLRIPWPHVRVDFLVSDNDWRFGEFTLRPGMAAGFNDRWDRKLGQMYVKAQARLMEDLIMGKDFNEYRQLLAGSGKSSKEGR